MHKVVSHVFWGMLAFLLSASFLHAATESNPPPPNTEPNPPSGNLGGFTFEFQNPLAFDSLTEFLTALLDIIVKIGFPLIVLAVVYIGFLFVKAQGNPEELQTAKRAFVWTLIGALIILGAAAISELIQNTVTQIRGGS